MATIGSLAVNIIARTDKFISGMNKSRKSVSMFTKTIQFAKKAVAVFSGALALVGSVAGVAFVKAQFSAVDALAKTSDKLGIATEQLAGLRLAAEESGVSTATLEMALQRMVRRIAEAAVGTGEAVKALQELGLDAVALARLSPDQQFRKIAEAMSRVSQQGDKVRLSMKLFDSEGVALVNTLKLGTEGLDEAQAAAQRLGLVVSRDMAAAVERANDAFARFKMAITGIARQIAIRLAPVVEHMSKAMEGFLTNDDRINKFADTLTRAFGRAIAFILSAIHKVGIQMELITARFKEEFAILGQSPLAKKLGIEMTDEQASNLTSSALDNRRRAAEMQRIDPGELFANNFNRWLDKANQQSKAPEKEKEVDKKALSQRDKQLEELRKMNEKLGRLPGTRLPVYSMGFTN